MLERTYKFLCFTPEKSTGIYHSTTNSTKLYHGSSVANREQDVEYSHIGLRWWIHICIHKHVFFFSRTTPRLNRCCCYVCSAIEITTVSYSLLQFKHPSPALHHHMQLYTLAPYRNTTLKCLWSVFSWVTTQATAVPP